MEEKDAVVEKKEKQADVLKALGFEALLAKKISTVKELRKAVKIIKELPDDAYSVRINDKVFKIE